jgi:hypothetical protein
MAHYDDIDVRGLTEAGIVACVVTLLCVLLAQVFFYWIDARTDPAVAPNEYTMSSEFLRKQQEGLVSQPAWVDKTNNRVSIPIDLAKQLTVEQYNKPGSKSPET